MAMTMMRLRFLQSRGVVLSFPKARSPSPSMRYIQTASSNNRLRTTDRLAVADIAFSSCNRPQLISSVTHLASFASTARQHKSPEPTRQAPKRSLDDKIEFVLHRVPIGSMNAAHVSFCHKTIHTLSRHMKNKGETAEKLLERVVSELEVGNPAVRSARVAVLYHSAMRAWARTVDTVEPADEESLPRSLLRAKQLLDRMHARHQARPDVHPRPDVFAYDAVLYACASSRFPSHATALAEDLIRVMEESGQKKSKGEAMLPSTISYNNVIAVYANQAPTHYGAASAAEDWLMHLSQLSSEGFGVAEPNTASFNRVLKAWGNSPETNGADRAKEILDLMLRLQTDHEEIQPDMISFATVIHAYGRRQQPEGAEAVCKCAMVHFHEVFQQQSVDIRQNLDLTVCINGAIFAWAQSDSPDAADRVEALLHDAYTLAGHFEHGKHTGVRIRPDAASHSAFLTTLIRSRRPGAVDAAQKHLQEIISAFRTSNNAVAPDESVFNAVINAWWKSGRPEAAEQAHELLLTMMNFSEKRGAPCAPAASTFIRCIDLWSKHKDFTTSREKALYLLNHAEQRKLVTFFTYKSAINVFRNRSANAFEAVKILERLEQHASLGVINLHSSILHDAVIDELARIKSIEAAEKALAILNRLKDLNVKPRTATYEGVLDNFISLRTERAAEVASLLFDEMKVLDTVPGSNVKLNTDMFGLILEILAGAHNETYTDKACCVLNYMLKLLGDGRSDVEPDARCLDSCLVALCRVNEKEYTIRAVQILDVAVKKHLDNTLRHSPSLPAFEVVHNSAMKKGLHDYAERVRTAAQSISKQRPRQTNQCAKQ